MNDSIPEEMIEQSQMEASNKPATSNQEHS
jgi:hypothetical protein